MEHRIKPFSQNGLFVMFENDEIQVIEQGDSFFTVVFLSSGPFYNCRNNLKAVARAVKVFRQSRHSKDLHDYDPIFGI